MRSYLLFSIVLLVLFASCKRKVGCTDPAASNYDFDSQKDCGCCEYTDPLTPYGGITANFNLKYRGSVYSLNDTIVDGDKELILEMFMFYISNIYLKNNSDSVIHLSKIKLVEFQSQKNQCFINIDSVPLGEYKEIGFGLGIDTILNNMDPSVFPYGHTLYGAKHWPGLKFVFNQIQGRADTTSADSFNLHLAYHTGTNSLYTPIHYLEYISVVEGSNDLIFDINIEDIFYNTDSIDYTIVKQIHMQSPSEVIEAAKFTNNFSKSIIIP